jgi:hypothetical protein
MYYTLIFATIKMKKYFSILFICSLVVFCSCAGSRKIEFTQEIRSKLESSNIDITKLQYYISKNLTLAREVTKDVEGIKKGRLVFENGKYYETISLAANTPGVCVMAYPNRLNVAFENEENKSLQFNAPYYDMYQVVGNDALTNNPNVVLYNGIQYALNYKGAAPTLLIKKSETSKVDRVDKKMKGRKVDY